MKDEAHEQLRIMIYELRAEVAKLKADNNRLYTQSVRLQRECMKLEAERDTAMICMRIVPPEIDKAKAGK